jgi:hypothetical protein
MRNVKTLCVLLISCGSLCDRSLAGEASATQTAGQLRRMQYKLGSSGEAALAWQKEVRAALFGLLKLNDLRTMEIPFQAKVISSKENDRYTLQELEIHSTPGRSIAVVLTIPKGVSKPCPAVVCIHGHGGNRHTVYDKTSAYKGFASVLANDGFVTISTDVGQHKVYEDGRILMGERLWDLMRCVDYLTSLKEVDKTRIGCAGLSLGGEMAMWLGAMDERIAATVSAGFLTVMDQMEKNHCMCWKFPGLRELVDYADIYSLIAPRWLQCQNGLQEGPTQFCVPIARQAMDTIKIAYRNLGQDNAALAVHEGGHEIDLPALMSFFQSHLRKS